MATCERRDQMPKQRSPVEYVLILSEKEAEALRAALGQFNSCGSGPLVNAIWESLYDAGINGASFRAFTSSNGTFELEVMP